jgi:hypothetical protein
MKRPLALLTWMLLLPAGFAPGGETPEAQLDRARKLREQKQYQPALDILEKLAKSPPASIASTLPLELARTRTQLALTQEIDIRAGTLSRARGDLAALLVDTKSADADAVLEAAHIDILLAKALLRTAKLAEDARAADAQLARAETHFSKGVKALADVEKRLSKARDKSACRLEAGQALTVQASAITSSGTAARRRKAELLAEGRKVLEALVKDFAKDVQDPSVYLARAWLVRCCKDGGDSIKSQIYYKELLAETRDEAATAKRWARAFFIQGIRLDKAGVQQVRKEAADWLKTYADFRDAPEGAVVRFQLASASAVEAQALSKDVKHPQASKLYEQAQDEFTGVAAIDSEYAEQAGQYALNLRFLRLADKIPLDSINDFEGCFLKGRYELGVLNDLMAKVAAAKTPAERDELEAKRKEQVKACVAAFDRALKMTDKSATAAALAEARFYLAYCHMAAGDSAKALDTSEELARASPPTKRSAAAAAYALDVAAVLLARDAKGVLRKRVRDLCSFILKERGADWANDPATSQAHYQLAMLAIADKKYPEAIAELEQVGPEYRNHLYARCQLVFLLSAAREATANETLRRQYLAKAVAVAQDLPSLPPQPDAETTALYFSAQIVAVNLIFEIAADQLETGKVDEALRAYSDIKARAATLKEQFDKLAAGLDDDAREKLTRAFAEVKMLGELGTARADYRAGSYDKVLKETEASVKAVLALAKDDKALLKLGDGRISGDLLGVALRAYIQLGNGAEARKVMVALRRIADEKTGELVGAEVLAGVVQELKLQLRDQRKAGDKAGLEATVKNFGTFLEALGKDDPGLTADRHFLIFLASCYAGIDKHAEAAKLFAKVTEPKADPKKKLTAKEQKEWQEYWAVQAAYGHSLRLDKKYAEARKVLERTINDPRATGKFQVEKELVLLAEDEGDWGRALTAWSEYLENPGLRQPGLDPKSKDAALLREMYFDGYYHFILSHYKYGRAKSRPEYVTKAGAMIATLESAKEREGWQLIGPRVEELMRGEGELRAAYEAAKKK